MISAEKFLLEAEDIGFNAYTGVPCSFLKPLINSVIDSEKTFYIPAANEGDAVGIAAGVYLGGGLPVVMFQNSGLGNAVNPFTSLIQTFQIPILMIVTLRGDPNRELDEPQHRLMGRMTTKVLDIMEVSWSWFPENESELDATMTEVRTKILKEKKPHVLVMKKGSVEPSSVDGDEKDSFDLTNAKSKEVQKEIPVETKLMRNEVINELIKATDENDLIIATTGYTGRELCVASDRSNHFYMVGSMGCAIDIGLGLAIMQPKKRVIVIDGDGALLMRLGAISTVGYMAPKNLHHLVLDNNAYESTGSQKTVSQLIDFVGIAESNNYKYCLATSSIQTLLESLRTAIGPSFVHFPIKAGVPEGLPRPTVSPEDVAIRFRKHALKDY